MIQESINQLLTTAGLAAKFSPALEKKRQMETLKAGEEILQKEANIANRERTKGIANLSTTTEKRRQLHSEAAKIEGEQYQNYRKQFELEPTSDIFGKMMSAQKAANMSRTAANELAKQKIENAITQDNEFKKLRKSIILDKTGKPFIVEDKNG